MIMRVTAAVVGAAAVVGLATSAWSQSAEQKGYAIAKAASERNMGYGDYSASGRMILRNKAGSEAVREFDYRSLEMRDGNRSLLVFNWPGDIRDTALLTHEREKGADSQWIFLPAQHRVKRIASASRSGSFVGSEFAYEDMVSQDLDAFNYKWLSEDSCCDIVQRMPKSKSGYSSQVVWFDKRNGTIPKVEYYNRGGALLKVLSATGYKQYNGFWRPATMTMSNRLTGKETILSWSNHQFGVGLSANAFTTRALERVR